MIRTAGPRRQDHSPVTVALVVLLAIVACGSPGGAGPSGACGLGGVANETEFGRQFTAMALEDATGDLGAPDPDAGVVFESADTIVVRATANEPAGVRLCVATRDGQGRIVSDIWAGFGPAEPTVALGIFEPGSYVVRVGVGEGAVQVLVRNLPFTIR